MRPKLGLRYRLIRPICAETVVVHFASYFSPSNPKRRENKINSIRNEKTWTLAYLLQFSNIHDTLYKSAKEFYARRSTEAQTTICGQVFIIFLPAARFLIFPVPPGLLAARFFAAVILPPLDFFAITNL